jgi:predicted metal-dependent phosphoesterase TrpH
VRIAADLHIHSCLSPCGDLEMSPRSIARTARDRGLSLIALTDHNTARNTPAFAAACAEAGIAALYGTEVTTREEVHTLALFDGLDAALTFGEIIYQSLDLIPHDPDRFGDQVVVDGNEVIQDSLDRFLGAPSRYTLTEVGSLIHEHGGLFIPAHIDRSVYSVWSQLGFLPEDDYDAVEMIGAPHTIDPGTYPVTASSDAHMLHAIGRRRVEFEAGDAQDLFSALRSALKTGELIRRFGP